MANLKQRLRRKNSSGSYDTIYLQTDLSNVTGTLSVSNGGTGATTTSAALTALGAAASSHNHAATDISTSAGYTVQAELNQAGIDIADLKTSVSSGKALVAAAVTDKGVPTAADATFQTMASNISQIASGVNPIDLHTSNGKLFTSSGGSGLYQSNTIFPTIGSSNQVAASLTYINAGGIVASRDRTGSIRYTCIYVNVLLYGYTYLTFPNPSSSYESKGFCMIYEMLDNGALIQKAAMEASGSLGFTPGQNTLYILIISGPFTSSYYDIWSQFKFT